MPLVELNPLNQGLLETAVSDGWFTDDAHNWRWGFGKGAEGALSGTQQLRALSQNTDPLLTVEGLWIDGQPRGIFAFRDLGAHRRTMQITPYVPGDDLEALALGTRFLTDRLFAYGKDRVFRLQAELLSTAREEKEALRGVGFKEEGLMRHAYWIGINSVNVVLLALTRPRWNMERLAA